MSVFLLSVDMPELDFVMCHKCHYTKTKYRAIRHNKSGDKKYFQCRRCGAYTTPNEGFWKMKYSGEVISAGIELYYAGVSLREISQMFWRLFGIKISRMGILKWVRKYAKQVEEFKKMKRPKLSGHWGVDEKFIKVKGKKGYLWLIKDKKRGFVIAKVLSEDRKASNAGKLFRKAKKIGNPKSVTHDGYRGYPKKVAKHFPDADDFQSKGFWHKHNNNSMESTNSEFNGRYKTMRGFGSFKSADDIIDGWVIHHNFIKRDRKRNKTNAERVGIRDVPSKMPWMYMIRKSAYLRILFSANF